VISVSKVASAIRFEQEEKEWIESFALMNGQSFSAQVREWVLERLEDELDARDLLEAVENSSGEFVSFDEAKKELLK